MDAPAVRAHTPRIATEPGDNFESERLARGWFAALGEGGFDQLGDLVHDDVVLVSKLRPGVVVEGKDDFVRFVEENLSASLYDATTSLFMPIDDTRVVVEGRLRWIDDDRVIRDDPVTWAMEFREGLLARFIPARTRVEAETILGASAP
jgi:ketosteroid isomerase-like protein